MHHLVSELYPICRSVTGNGFRETLRRIQEHIPLCIHEVPTGTQVFDWTIPREWNIRDAWIADPHGAKVVDFGRSNLHVVNYSIPIHSKMPLRELREHLHTLPDRPDWIPYRTSYYQESWGFCLSHHQLQALEEGEYEVYIDSHLDHGSLTYGELYIPGERADEILISCHACHPSLANDNLSGVSLVTYLAKLIIGVERKHSYRFLFLPGTIGPIAWLALNEDKVAQIRHGLVVACVGDPGKFHYKKSRRGDTEIDQAAVHALRHSGESFEVVDFSPYGYDERQYCSPGFNLPVGSLTRTPHGRFPEYHTSADDLDFIRPGALGGSLAVYLNVLSILDGNTRYINLNPKCEPQLGKRGLYRTIGGLPEAGPLELAILWVLNQSDGTHSLLEIADRSGLPFYLIHQASHLLTEARLLEQV